MSKLGKLLAVALVLVAIPGAVRCNDEGGIFTSNADLQGLLWTEGQLVEQLRLYLLAEERKMEKVKEYIRSYEQIQAAADGNEERYVGNPLNSYLLIKKMTADWKELQGFIEHSPATNFLNNVTEYKQVFKWPSEEDLSGAAVALMRLQDTYQLDPEALARGELNGVSYGSKLTANDCFELGRQSYNVGDHYHSRMWMQQALKLWDNEVEKSVDRADILEYMAFSAYIQGNMRRALRLTQDLLRIQPDHPRAAGNLAYYENAIAAEGGKIQKRGEDGLGDAEEPEEVSVAEAEPKETPGHERKDYEKLCRGEESISEAYRARLHCYYDYGQHSYLRYSPYKAEEAYLKPRILIYHDVITDQEIEKIKSLAIPRFRRATVQNYKTGELETANYRISKTAWLKRAEGREIDRIYRRVGDITGLNMDTSEELQVSNYGIGGHYEPHFDFARREEVNAFASLGTGNRIATWLFYESDVEQGGATVFPPLGIALWPKKGSAAFWYNLHRNGEGDDMTRHAACPVLAGSKWVSNFWVHERGQEFTRPCDKSPFV